MSTLADLALRDSCPTTRGISCTLMPSPIKLSEVEFMGLTERQWPWLAALYEFTNAVSLHLQEHD